MKKKLTTKLLAHWAQMTDDNLHYEVRIEIAKWAEDIKSEDEYVDGKYVSYVGMFNELQNAINNGSNMIETLCLLTHLMLKDIERVYGKSVADKIDACL